MNSKGSEIQRRNNRKMNRSRSIALTALLFVLCLFSTRAIAQDPASRQLTLIRPDDQEFEELLNTNFPGLDRLDGYATFSK